MSKMSKREADSRGAGAVQVNGAMIDVAVRRLVRNTLKQADLYGL
jgi:citrate lyase subunit beta/citryl-CoA lyase